MLVAKIRLLLPINIGVFLPRGTIVPFIKYSINVGLYLLRKGLLNLVIESMLPAKSVGEHFTLRLFTSLDDDIFTDPITQIDGDSNQFFGCRVGVETVQLLVEGIVSVRRSTRQISTGLFETTVMKHL